MSMDSTESDTSDLQAMSPTESLMSAIQSFDVDTVEKLLKSDFEIEYRHKEHYSVLHTAVSLIDPDKLNEVRYKEESDEHPIPSYDHEALRRIIEALLVSGRFNVNASTKYCESVLHLAVQSCRCMFLPSDDYTDMVNAIIELLLKNHCNANAKDFDGTTPLSGASYHGCSHIVKILIDWKDKHGARVDLNAKNTYGETALIMAAIHVRVDVIELLLDHGCLDVFYDHRGFNALHTVICGSGLFDDATSDFLSLIGVHTAAEINEVLEQYDLNRYAIWPENDSIQKTVIMLLASGRVEINAKDFRGNTVLDLALRSKLGMSQETIEKLKEYGATSEHHQYPRTTLEYTDKQGKTPLHRLSAALPELTLGIKAEIFDHHIHNSSHKEAFEKMTVAKDHRGRTVLHSVLISTRTNVTLKSEDILQLINILKLKPIINEKDNYGRTPLHYCEYEGVFKSLVEQGANEHIQDIHWKTPRDLNKLRNEERNRYNLREKLENEIYTDKIDSWIIWKEAEYACHDQFSIKMSGKVRQFMNRLSDEIGKRDPRFECRPVLIGSAEEGTKIGLPDEFDFNFILIKLSELCEVVPSPVAPYGFVHLKRRSHSAEYLPENRNVKSQLEFDGFFNSSGFLSTTDLLSKFRTLYLEVMSEPELWTGESFFEWEQHNEAGLWYDKSEREFDVSRPSNKLEHFCNIMVLKLILPIEGRYMFTPISVDIVPCIKLNGWWPEQALSSVSDNIKLEGCHLMFDQTKRKYPWVPISDPFAKISFAPAEGRAIRECSAVARAAYMVGKQLLGFYNQSQFSYVLKTCLLYCIEALKDCTKNSLLYEDIDPNELRYFVEKLMLCFREFYWQDFLPCYMMPSFHLPIEEEFKSTHEKLRYDSSYKCETLFDELYSSVCSSKSQVDLSPPTPEPLNEKFNRDELMMKLTMDSSSI